MSATAAGPAERSEARAYPPSSRLTSLCGTVQ
jgi:hypothetical protein